MPFAGGRGDVSPCCQFWGWREKGRDQHGAGGGCFALLRCSLRPARRQFLSLSPKWPLAPCKPGEKSSKHTVYYRQHRFPQISSLLLQGLYPQPLPCPVQTAHRCQYCPFKTRAICSPLAGEELAFRMLLAYRVAQAIKQRASSLRSWKTTAQVPDSTEERNAMALLPIPVLEAAVLKESGGLARLCYSRDSSPSSGKMVACCIFLFVCAYIHFCCPLCILRMAQKNQCWDSWGRLLGFTEYLVAVYVFPIKPTDSHLPLPLCVCICYRDIRVMLQKLLAGMGRSIILAFRKFKKVHFRDGSF